MLMDGAEALAARVASEVVERALIAADLMVVAASMIERTISSAADTREDSTTATAMEGRIIRTKRNQCKDAPMLLVMDRAHRIPNFAMRQIANTAIPDTSAHYQWMTVLVVSPWLIPHTLTRIACHQPS